MSENESHETMRSLAGEDSAPPPLWPHAGGCVQCRRLGLCNVCGHPLMPSTRCTNGRCVQCHELVCTGGGTDSPGHGCGSPEAALKAAARRRKMEEYNPKLRPRPGA